MVPSTALTKIEETHPCNLVAFNKCPELSISQPTTTVMVFRCSRCCIPEISLEGISRPPFEIGKTGPVMKHRLKGRQSNETGDQKAWLGWAENGMTRPPKCWRCIRILQIKYYSPFFCELPYPALLSQSSAWLSLQQRVHPRTR